MKALHNYSQEPLSWLADWLNHNGGDPQFSMGTLGKILGPSSI